MRELFYGIGGAVLIGLAGGAMMKPDLVPALTRDGSMTPVEPGYAYDDAASYAPSVTPIYYDSWTTEDRALLMSASYDSGDTDIPSYDPRPAPEDRAEAIRDATLQDNLSAPAPDQTTARYPSADGDILAGLTPHTPVPPLSAAGTPASPVPAPPAPAPLVPPVSDDSASAGDTSPASPS